MGYRYQKKSNKGMLETGVLMLVWGAWFVICFGYGLRVFEQQLVLWDYYKAQNWLPTEATLDQVRFGRRTRLIEYNYVVRGKTYFGAYSYNDDFVTPKDRGKISPYNLGVSIRIVYNPRRSSESSLQIYEPTDSAYSKQARDAVWLIPLSSLIALVLSVPILFRMGQLVKQK